MEHNGGANFTKVTKVNGATVHFTTSFAYTASFGHVVSSTSSYGAGFIISGAKAADSKITVGGVDISASTFDTGTLYNVGVEKVVAASTDYIYVFSR